MLCKFMTFASGWATQHNLLPSKYVDLSPSLFEEVCELGSGKYLNLPGAIVQQHCSDINCW